MEANSEFLRYFDPEVFRYALIDVIQFASAPRLFAASGGLAALVLDQVTGRAWAPGKPMKNSLLNASMSSKVQYSGAPKDIVGAASATRRLPICPNNEHNVQSGNTGIGLMRQSCELISSAD